MVQKPNFTLSEYTFCKNRKSRNISNSEFAIVAGFVLCWLSGPSEPVPNADELYLMAGVMDHVLCCY